VIVLEAGTYGETFTPPATRRASDERPHPLVNNVDQSDILPPAHEGARAAAQAEAGVHNCLNALDLV
jgi:hypothetical protein